MAEENQGNEGDLVNKGLIRRFIDVDLEIATIAGEIRRSQKKENNRVIKSPDSLIVATAIHKKYDLFTFDKGMRFAQNYGVQMIE